jgi:hypothetical protein
VEILGVYRSALQKHPDGITVGELIESSSEANAPVNTLQALSMLLHGGWCMLHQTGQDSKVGRSCNAALSQAVCDGAPYRFISLPRAGAALSISEVEWFFVAAALDGRKEAAWPEAAQQSLRRLNRSLLKEGKPVTDPAEQLEQLRGLAATFAQTKHTMLKRLGAL